MFMGRERERVSLNTFYKSDTVESAVLCGRRVGKTALISQFIDGKPNIFSWELKANARQNLENFSKKQYRVCRRL